MRKAQYRKEVHFLRSLKWLKIPGRRPRNFDSHYLEILFSLIYQGRTLLSSLIGIYVPFLGRVDIANINRKLSKQTRRCVQTS